MEQLSKRSEFLVLIHDNPESRPFFPSPEETQATAQLFREWIGRIAVRDKLINLPGIWDLESCIIKQDPDNPKELIAETGKSIGGLFLIKAKDYEEAVSIAKGCPALHYGAIIEVRMAIE